MLQKSLSFQMGSLFSETLRLGSLIIKYNHEYAVIILKCLFTVFSVMNIY